MPLKAISFREGNTIHECQLDSSVDKEELYGKVTRIVQTPGGEVLVKGILTQEGKILPSNAVGNVKVDAKGSLTEPTQFQREGVAVLPKPSSFKEPKDITTATLSELSTFAADSVYPLIPAATLKPGCYRSTFNYRDAVDPSDAMLIVRGTGEPSFVLVGEKKEFAPVGQAQLYNIFDAEGADSEDEDDSTGGFGFDNV